ncbi:MAG: prolyl-tRNA synthetase associated domain-containing protein [Bacteroidales bacterium]|nr:prolyl-tRNA synthetase associated domain-containing protein [Bacteroidales bacterium]RLD36673.1 MAG: prolyl-tRNA synthetase associated domain-containing protein [Bacteroidota bacterium]
MNDRTPVFNCLNRLNISFEMVEHPPAPTIAEAMKYWKDIEAVHCKNLFFRNHKGNKHYLVVFNAHQQLAIHELEKRLKQGKLSFASEKRLAKYLGIQAGSVSPFGLINDVDNHVHLFLDAKLQKSEKISFHPNDNTASIVISFSDFLRYLNNVGNSFEFIDLYD